MKTIKTAIKWIYGIGLPIFGFQILFTKSFLGGLFIILSGLFLLPITLKLFDNRIGKPLTKFQRRFAILGSLFAGSFFMMISGASNYHHESVNSSPVYQSTGDNNNSNSVIESKENKASNTSDTRKDYVSSISSIKVSSIIVKKVDGKFKYWFDIRNVGKTPFSGIVKIWCINDEESAEFDESFQTSRPIEPKLGTVQFIELNTGTTDYHGANGISKFRFEVIINDNVVQTGRGRITNKFEDLD